jgi:hypothetical protein
MAGRIKVAPKEARTRDGIVFDSRAEMKRYDELKMLERSGLVSEIVLQPRFVLQEAFDHPEYGRQRVIEYVADFGYKEGGKKIIEDCKGHRTDVYKLKKKLLLARYPAINFREVKA